MRLSSASFHYTQSILTNRFEVLKVLRLFRLQKKHVRNIIIRNQNNRQSNQTYGEGNHVRIVAAQLLLVTMYDVPVPPRQL